MAPASWSASSTAALACGAWFGGAGVRCAILEAWACGGARVRHTLASYASVEARSGSKHLFSREGSIAGYQAADLLAIELQ
ncbi:hypothetical protein EJB05_01481, partial [Eragrostis curvula]